MSNTVFPVDLPAFDITVGQFKIYLASNLPITSNNLDCGSSTTYLTFVLH